MPHFIITPAGEGLGQGILLDPQQVKRALSVSDAIYEGRKMSLAPADIDSVEADEEGLYVTRKVSKEVKPVIPEKEEV